MTQEPPQAQPPTQPSSAGSIQVDGGLVQGPAVGLNQGTITTNYHYHVSAPPPDATARRNRRRMLANVSSFWITGVLEHALGDLPRLNVGFEQRADLVVQPWQQLIQETTVIARTLPPDANIRDVFDVYHGAMLILGAPGAGKTTLLLDLARELVARAEQDDAYPMPIIFHLSSCGRRKPPWRTG
jgi:hypothetical protein